MASDLLHELAATCAAGPVFSAILHEREFFQGPVTRCSNGHARPHGKCRCHSLFQVRDCASGARLGNLRFHAARPLRLAGRSTFFVAAHFGPAPSEVDFRLGLSLPSLAALRSLNCSRRSLCAAPPGKLSVCLWRYRLEDVSGESVSMAAQIGPFERSTSCICTAGDTVCTATDTDF